MEPKRTPTKDDVPSLAPELAEVDWDGIDTPDLPDNVTFDNGDIRPEDETEGEVEGDLAEEDDDNPAGESDEALPDDREERVLDRNPSKEGGRFDEV